MKSFKLGGHAFTESKVAIVKMPIDMILGYQTISQASWFLIFRRKGGQLLRSALSAKP